MFEIHVEEIEWGGKPLRFETGRVARQADGAVLVTYGETTVLATAVAARSPRSGIDFFPLTVNYQEKAYAAGKIPGGYLKREARPSEKETLVSRLIDRPIRPLFAKGFKNETQIITTVISYDNENDPDIVALIATSAALTLSGIPFMGPIGAARVGYADGEYILNPTIAEKETSSLDLVVAGTRDAVLMVESEADELTEEIMRRYGLSYEDAGRVKRTGGLPDNYEPEVLEPFKKLLVQQVNRYLQFFFSGDKNDYVDQIVLAGGSATIPGIAEMIEAEIGTPTIVANPFENLHFHSSIDKARVINDGPALMIACGLALRGFD